MKLFICVLLCSVAYIQAQGFKNYTGYKTYRVTPKSYAELDILDRFSGKDDFDFWSKVRLPKKPIDLMVGPGGQFFFEINMKLYGIEYEVLIGDVELILEREREEQIVALREADSRISFNRYYRYSEIQDYLQELQSNYRNLVNVVSIGDTYEGRSHDLIKISSGGGGSRPAVFIDAGIHAREWAAPALALYIINQLVENYSDNSDLVDSLDWFIVPVANPDGYEYTHTSDRFWRKTRSQNSGTTCRGSDPNRNYGFHWGEVGASSSPCSETYKGPRAFSEIETVNMRNFEETIGSRFRGYIALHSYGPYWLYPWGYTWDLPTDWRDLDDLGNEAADAIRSVRGSDYVVGSSTRVLYAAAGGSDDYAKGVLGCKYAYTVEVVGGGSQGFDLPPSQILNVVEEAWEGIKVFAQQVARP